ncbi:MAG: M48 family metallopeptidase [Acidobacteriaceae bacterium]
MHPFRIATLALLFLASTAFSSAQVLTSAIVSVNEPAGYSASAPSESAPAARSNAATLQPASALPAPLHPVHLKPLPAPSAQLRALAVKYDVSQIGSRDVSRGMNFYSLQREIAMGRELSQQVEQESTLLDDPVITEYINRLGQQLVRNSDAKVPFTIKVIDSDEVNAFALPGGFFYVNTGLILATDDEAELAGVMAHEIAHVAARHATRNETKSQVWNLASIPLIFVAGPAGMAARDLVNVAAPMSFLKFNRDAEREADLLGIEYAYKSGYDPRAMVDLFERLDSYTSKRNKKKPNLLAQAFASHPMNGDRIARAQQEIAYILPPRDSYIETTSEFDRIKARLFALEGAHHLRMTPGKPVLRVRTKDQASADAANTAPPEDGPVLHRRRSN